MKTKFILLLSIFILISLGVGAVECNADLSNAGNSCTVSSSLTLNGTYSVNINGTSTSVGAIQINANNLIFDCNQTEIYGNWSAGVNNAFIGVYVNTKNNVTVQNCRVRNYNYGIRERLSNNTVVINSNFTNNRMGIYKSLNNTNSTYSGNLFYESNSNSYAGIWIQDFMGSGMTVVNNTFYDINDGIREETTNSNFANANITGNTFYQGTFDSTNERPAIIQIGGSGWTINNNYVYGAGTTAVFSYGIDVRGQNNTASNNYVYGTQYGMSCSGCSNFIMINNTIDFNDDPIILNAKNIYIYNNTFINNTLNVDGYNVGLNIYNSSNIIVSGNNFTEVATAGINVQGSINISVLNNTFDFIPLSSRNLYLANDGNEPRCAIQFLIYYKGFIPTAIQVQGNDNITVTGNIFDSDTPCLLRTENITGLSSDLNSYKTGVNFIAPTSFSSVLLGGMKEWYMPTAWTNLSRYSPIQGIRFDMHSNLGGSSLYINYSMTPSYLFLHNENATSSMNISLFNQSNSLVYFSNFTVVCTSNCNGQINYTIPSKNLTYVLNNFNLTEGISRENSPIWFSSTTATSKHIASNLSQSVIVSIITNIGDCITKNKITYTTDSNIKTIWIGNDAKTICEQFKMTGVALSIEPAQNSNILSWEDGTTGMQTSISKLVIGFIALLITIIAVAGVIMYVKVIGSNINIEQIVMILITILICVILGGILIDYIYTLL